MTTENKEKPMKIYIAAKYEESEKAKRLMNIFREEGHTITFDWTREDPDPDGDIAQKLVKAVKQADVLVVLMLNSHTSQGVWVEIGIALAHNIPIIAIGQAKSDCIFLQHPLVVVFKDQTESEQSRMERIKAHPFYKVFSGENA